MAIFSYNTSRVKQEVALSIFTLFRALRRIRSALTKNMSQTTAWSHVSSRLANALFLGLSDLRRLQRIKNYFAREVLRLSHYDHAPQSYYISCFVFLLNS